MFKLEEVFHRHELQNLIIGNESVKVGEVIQAITGFLGRKERSSTCSRKKSAQQKGRNRESDFIHLKTGFVVIDELFYKPKS